MNVDIKIADYLNTTQAKDIIDLLDSYAQDKMGGSTPLPEKVKSNLTEKLSKMPHAFTVLCYVNDKAAGLINCFENFSTFKCKPLINIHDVVVSNEFRGYGLSQLMLAKVEEIAVSRGCCKITLEILEGNVPAKNAYAKYGFSGYELDPEMGKAMFWQKQLIG